MFRLVSVRLMIPRGPEDGALYARPLDVFASDIEALIEVKPEGKVFVIRYLFSIHI
jgi:hypothetical protein